MTTRRDFFRTAGAFTLAGLLLPQLSQGARVKKVGIQLYTLQKEMMANPRGTLEALAKMGYKELESATSDKGIHYGLSGSEMKKVTQDLGLRLVSGHVNLGKDWQKTVDQAAEAGQTYLVCASLPSWGQSVANYQKVAQMFNSAAEACQKANLIFGYHNHEYEFEKKDGQVLYDILLQETDPNLVKMEMDLGWAAVVGIDPMAYFLKHPGRFPLWHLKDMKKDKAQSTEFGKGRLDIAGLFRNAQKAGMKHFFVEQEHYTTSPMASVEHNLAYLKKLNY